MAPGPGLNRLVSMKYKAFTLVEILIVVIILGILAAIVLPKFSNASAEARASMLADNLRLFRSQIQVYKEQHMGIPPGPDAQTFCDQMTKASNRNGETAAPGTPGFTYGPYFSQMPMNPINGKNTVQIISAGNFPTSAADANGWVYQPSTVTFSADCVGSDEGGRSFFDY
jgi:general secretion pathway protein G